MENRNERIIELMERYERLSKEEQRELFVLMTDLRADLVFKIA